MSDMQQPSSKKARKQTMPGADVCPVNALDALRMFHNHRGNVTGGYMRVLLNALDALPARPASNSRAAWACVLRLLSGRRARSKIRVLIRWRPAPLSAAPVWSDCDFLGVCLDPLGLRSVLRK